MRSTFYNISLICAHAPTKEKDDVVSDAFYAKLHVAKIVLGDFNATLSLAPLWLLRGNIVVCSTMFQHLGIHKVTWMSTDRSTSN